MTNPVPLVLDLHIAHERFGSSSDPSINGHLHYPNDVDRSLNEFATDKIHVYTRRVDPSTLVFSLSSHRHSYIRLLSSPPRE